MVCGKTEFRSMIEIKKHYFPKDYAKEIRAKKTPGELFLEALREAMCDGK